MNMKTKAFTFKELAEFYDVDATQISRDWVSRGFDITAPRDELFKWIHENYLRKLKTTDNKEQLVIEQVRLTKAKADREQIEIRKANEELIEVELVQAVVTQQYNQLKKDLRMIPQAYHLELAVLAEEPLILRDRLQEIIDDTLRDQNYNYIEEEQDGESEEDPDDTTGSDESTTTATENKTE
ncbi:hypothetical protein ACFIPR_003210 [Enterobacter kobei]